MLKQRLLHPEILDALASAGHGARVMIADGNYPVSTRIGANAQLVFLNLAPGKLTVTEVLDIVLTAIPVEEAMVWSLEMKWSRPSFRNFAVCCQARHSQNSHDMSFMKKSPAMIPVW